MSNDGWMIGTGSGEPEKQQQIGICRCGHPVDEHYVGEGCQAARSYRPESLGGGIGTSRCECIKAVELLKVDRVHILRFRQSPIKGHALARAMQSMRSAGVDGSEMEWDTEQLYCEASGHEWSGECSPGVLTPYYTDREASRTVFMCDKHAAPMIKSGMVFTKVRAHLTKDQRRERIDRHREALNDEAYRKARGLDEMSQPVSDLEAERTIKRQREREREAGTHE